MRFKDIEIFFFFRQMYNNSDILSKTYWRQPIMDIKSATYSQNRKTIYFYLQILLIIEFGYNLLNH